MCTEFKGKNYNEIISEINGMVRRKEKDLINSLPDYAFAYEEGDKYVRTDYRVRIESQLKSYRDGLLHDALRYALNIN